MRTGNVVSDTLLMQGLRLLLDRTYLKRTRSYWGKDNDCTHWQHADGCGQSRHIHTKNIHIRTRARSAVLASGRRTVAPISPVSKSSRVSYA